MKRWLTANFFSNDNMMNEPSVPSGDVFTIELSMIALALAFFGIVLHVFAR